MNDHKNDLNEDEREALSEYESGVLQSDPNLAERMKELRTAARNTQNKTRNINIRLTEKDLSRLKSRAVEEGIPYQTLVSSILHKAVSSYYPDIPAWPNAPEYVKPMYVNSTTSHSSESKENPNE